MIRVQAWNEFVSPKIYGPLAIWPWLRRSPHSFANVSYCLILTAWQWLMSLTYTPCIPMQINPIKAHWGTGFWPFSFERWVIFPPQADHVLVDLFSTMVARGALWVEPPHNPYSLTLLHHYTITEHLFTVNKHLFFTLLWCLVTLIWNIHLP